jgi:hypothetical protein
MKFIRSNWHRKIELIANVCIILSGLFIAVRLLKPDLLSSSYKQERTVNTGAKLPLTGVEWSLHKQNVVLALSEGCRFCAESGPFYKRLARGCESSKDIHVIAALPAEPSESRRYLSGLDVQISDVREANLTSLGVSYTPTVLLVDRAGIVRHIWVGKLSNKEEAELLAKLGLPQ